MYPGSTNFYPRSPCGERRRFRAIQHPKINISIHALLAESDILYPLKTFIILTFLSTLSLRRATLVQIIISGYARISIHALLAESDPRLRQKKNAIRDFYPRSPCGERHDPIVHIEKCYLFLSTLSLRRATAHFAWFRLTYYLRFLSTLSLRRATQTGLIGLNSGLYFYPRSPCGERRWIASSQMP